MIKYMQMGWYLLSPKMRVVKKSKAAKRNHHHGHACYHISSQNIK